MNTFSTAALRNPRSLWRLLLPLGALLLVATGLFYALLPRGAEGATQTINNFTVTDSISHDFVNETTTVTYDITVNGSPALSHVVFNVCLDFNRGSYTVTKGGSTIDFEYRTTPDPETGTTGVKIDQGQNEGTTVRYTITIDQLVEGVTGDLGIKAGPGDTHFNVVTLGCEELANDPLVIEKTVDASFDRSFDWTVEKSVAPDSWELFDGDTATSDYTVEVTKGDPVDENYQVSGTITITNPNPVPVEVTNIDDVVDGQSATIIGCATPFDVPADSSVDCDYELTTGLDGDESQNTVTVTAENDLGDSDTVDFDYAMNVVNDEVTVSDTNGEFGGDQTINSSEIFNYSITFNCANLSDGDYVDGVASFTHENTATLNGDSGNIGSSSADVDITCYRLDISKTVDTSFIRTWNWDVEKSADPTELNMVNGQSGTVAYEIVVDKVDFTDSDFAVSGTITINNPHPTRDAELNSLIDELSSGESFNCANDTVPAGDSTTCDYQFDDLDDGSERDNTATAVQQNSDFDSTGNPSAGGTTEYAVAEDVVFGDPDQVIHAQVDLDDSVEGPLGTFGDDNTVTYEIEYTCGEDAGDHDNTATITGDNDEVLDQDTETITVTCSDLDPLSVEKTAEGSFTRAWNWDVEKSADPTELHLFDGDTGEIEYAVDATRTGSTDRDFLVSGSITIVNENPVAVTVTSVVDTITPGDINADVTCPGGLPAELAPAGEDGDTLVCTYTADGNDGLDGDENLNTVVVETEGDAANGSDEQAFDYDITEIDATVSVDDTNAEFGGPHTISMSTPFDPYTVQFTCANLADGDYVNGVASYTFDNTATVTGEAGELDSDIETITVNCYRLDVTKTADTSFDRRFEWTIDKSADPTTHNLLVGESGTSEYTIEVTKSDPIDENHAVSGTISIVNPNPNRDANLTQVLDTVSPGLAAMVDCPSMVVPAGGSLDCSYSRDLPNGDQRTNTATATLQNVDIDAEGVETNSSTSDYSSGPVDVIFGDPDSVELDSISVVDTYDPAPDPWNFSDDGSVNYSREFVCTADDLNGESSVTLNFPNTATIVETDQSDDALVVVNCSEQQPLQVSKTVNLEFDRTWEWDIEKTAVPSAHNLVNDEEGVTNYTIEVTQMGPIDSNWQISGVISITNPATVAATVTGVSDVVSQTGLGDTNVAIQSCQIEGADVGVPSAGSPVTLDPGATMLCAYAGDLPGGADGTNVATVSTTGEVPGAGTAEDVEFAGATMNEMLAQIEVTDSYDGAPDPWTFTGSDAVGYSRTFNCVDVDFGDDNTASYVVENTATITETGASDDADVTVNCTLVEDPGTITVTKLADPDDSPWVFQFDGPGELGADLATGQSSSATLEPGIYTISENLEEIEGVWELIDITCESASGESVIDVDLNGGSVTIDLAAGDTVDCTFFNTSDAPPVVIPEAPLAILFPAIGLLVAAGGYLFWRRREQPDQAG